MFYQILFDRMKIILKHNRKESQKDLFMVKKICATKWGWGEFSRAKKGPL